MQKKQRSHRQEWVLRKGGSSNDDNKIESVALAPSPQGYEGRAFVFHFSIAVHPNFQHTRKYNQCFATQHTAQGDDELPKSLVIASSYEGEDPKLTEQGKEYANHHGIDTTPEAVYDYVLQLNAA